MNALQSRYQRYHRKVRVYMRAKMQALGCVSCGYNGNPLALEWDHIVPSGRSHANHTTRRAVNTYKDVDRMLADPNVQVLCGSCHNIKSNQERMAWYDGLGG